jgi:hypothetical protein
VNAQVITVRGQDFWVQAYPIGNNRWDAVYYRVIQGHPMTDFAVARLNSGDPNVPLDQNLLCLGLSCFTPQDAEGYVEYYIEAFLSGRHHPRVFSVGNSL